MKKVLLFLITVLFFCLNVFAGDGDYAVSKIAPALLKNANAIVRLEDISFEIKNTHDIYERTHLVITIMNENADKWSEFVAGYDKLQEFISAEGALYDANGKFLKLITSFVIKLLIMRGNQLLLLQIIEPILHGLPKIFLLVKKKLILRIGMNRLLVYSLGLLILKLRITRVIWLTGRISENSFIV